MLRQTSQLRRHYEQTYQSLSRVELQRGIQSLDDLELNQLFDYDSDLWLGFYTEEGLRLALKRYGLGDDIHNRGFTDFQIELSMEDPDEQMLRVWSRNPACEEPLLELVVSRAILHFKEDAQPLNAALPFARVLNIQWLLMQNPLGSFGPERLPLPGQAYPGLGLGEQVLELLKNSCRRLNLDGLMTVPAHFHNAVIYGQTFHYIDPTFEGKLRALQRNLARFVKNAPPSAQLSTLSWAVHWKMVFERQRRKKLPFEWFHEAMVYPISDEFKAYFNAKSYLNEMKAARKSHRFELFKTPMERALASSGMVPWQGERAQEWVKQNLFK